MLIGVSDRMTQKYIKRLFRKRPKKLVKFFIELASHILNDKNKKAYKAFKKSLLTQRLVFPLCLISDSLR